MPAAVVSTMIGGACPSVTGSIVGMKCVVGYIGDWVQRAESRGWGGRTRRVCTYICNQERECVRVDLHWNNNTFVEAICG